MADIDENDAEQARICTESLLQSENSEQLRK